MRIAILAAMFTVASLALLAPDAQADTFVVRNTGTNVVNNVDQSWNITSSPYDSSSQSAFVSTNAPGTFPYNGYWMPNDSTSKWIQPLSTSADNHLSDVPYTYQTTFSLDGLDATTAQFDMRLSADNAVSQVTLNGHALDISHEGYRDFSAWFTVSDFFTSGLNTLIVEVLNFPQATGNPSSLRVEFDNAYAQALPTTPGGVATPEPASLIVWSLLLGGVYYRARHAKKSRAEV